MTFTLTAFTLEIYSVSSDQVRCCAVRDPEISLAPPETSQATGYSYVSKPAGGSYSVRVTATLRPPDESHFIL